MHRVQGFPFEQPVSIRLPRCESGGLHAAWGGMRRPSPTPPRLHPYAGKNSRVRWVISALPLALFLLSKSFCVPSFISFFTFLRILSLHRPTFIVRQQFDFLLLCNILSVLVVPVFGKVYSKLLSFCFVASLAYIFKFRTHFSFLRVINKEIMNKY